MDDKKIITDENEYLAKTLVMLSTKDVPKHIMAANEGFIRQCWRRGWTIEDVRAYVLCFEEFSPEMDEDTALARMAAIEKKYPF